MSAKVYTARSTANKPTTTIYSTLRDRALRDLDTGELNRDGTEELGPSQGARGANELHEEPQVYDACTNNYTTGTVHERNRFQTARTTNRILHRA